ncbi:hypothetical protein [Pluralibacter gergoviae]|uniref:DUF2157 domain-containing protein n=1 Tax=Pluralibacter gergoviae TaxID=61647 RepID=A0AAW8HWQ1_PLUGE|nr:hypothetical protein [Pluralibacter gergoviae]EKW9968891.1 hypothetical protein [Pluralibacter gergoviae]ELD4301378.1 hypothetical protein [Pluralibacter gergoviae]ELN2738020.1 hypothetical protein [Pluralibacter gergoviae]ELO7481762.1 hypothetical protein [Pluralibacter gergoviae]ELW9442582.1 hypothetical protein [Pluralibacter gergoviae]
MKAYEIETLLIQNGFNPKEISVMKLHAEKHGHPYLWLLQQLKKRFIVSVVLMLILLVGGILTFIYGSYENKVSYSVMLIIGFIIIYVFTPLNTGYKACKLLSRNSHLL